jgi:hypothetical protein
MNRLEDGTGWILPPRCASRFTAELIWKYGMVSFREHGLDWAVRPTKVIMNIRHPVTRFCSFYRLFHGRSVEKMTFDDYVMNLANPIHHVSFTNTVLDVVESHEPWAYPVPLYRYTEELAEHALTVDHFVRFEHLEDDLAAAGYPVLTHKNDKIEYETPNVRPEDTLTNDQLGLIWQLYKRDFEEFGYEVNHASV